MRKIFFVLILAGPAALAKPIYLSELQRSLPQGVGLPLKCATCHAGGPQLNAFGRDFAQAKFQLSRTNPDWLKALMQQDSDQDGVSNYDEIVAGTAPGVKGK